MTRAGTTARLVALLLGLSTIGWAAARPAERAPDRRPNLLLVVTDDQTWDSLDGSPEAMPWLARQLADPARGWIRFTDATVSTPVCCPSRVTILTGSPAWETGVARNSDGRLLDPRETVIADLQRAGYTTGLVGKYLNGYPWDLGPHVPDGWDRWVAKLNVAEATTYFSYPVIEQTSAVRVERTPEGYSTDWLGERAASFIRAAPSDRPWLLAFTPSAPHPPFTPAPRHAGALEGAPPAAPALDELNDVADAPAWVRALPPIDAARAASLARQRLAARETLLAVDEALARLWDEVVARDQADRTVVLLTSDNGYSFGEHRWVGKRCPYRGCVQVPFVARTPWGPGGVTTEPVSTLDLAPTIAELAGIAAARAPGRSLVPILRGAPSIPPAAPRVSWYVGDAVVPAWWSVRDDRYALILTEGGGVELYDVRTDPAESHDLAPTHRDVVARLSRSVPDLPIGTPR